MRLESQFAVAAAFIAVVGLAMMLAIGFRLL